MSGAKKVRRTNAIIEEAAPDGMGTGEKPDKSGISIGQAVFATEDEPHLLAALLGGSFDDLVCASEECRR